MEGRVISQIIAGHGNQESLELIQHLAGLFIIRLQAVLHMRIKIIEDLGLRSRHFLCDLCGVLLLQNLESSINLFSSRALVKDSADLSFEVEPVFNSAENFVTGPKNAIEELELTLKQLQDALFSDVALIGEVDHHDVVLLAKTVDTADTLFHALRIPRQVIVDQHGAELKVDTLSGSFRSDHDRPMVPEVIHQGFTTIGSWDAGDDVAVLVFRQPVLVDGHGGRRIVLPVEQDKSLAAPRIVQGLSEVLLGLRRVSENNRFLGGTNFSQFGETSIQRIAQVDGLLIDRNGAGQVRKSTQFFDLCLNPIPKLMIRPNLVSRPIFTGGVGFL